ncbi:MAG: hypothetical protein RL685_3632 [Pseudomonadota bacterium]
MNAAESGQPEVKGGSTVEELQWGRRMNAAERRAHPDQALTLLWCFNGAAA